MSFRFRALSWRAAAALAIASPLVAQQAEKVDTAAITKIRNEGFQRSKVMEITSYLTDVYGARLTGSPSIKAAGDWVVGQLKTWGIANPRLEPWGPFGRGWSNEKFVARVVSPTQYPLIAYPGAWSVGTNGPVTGDVVMARIDTATDTLKFKGALRGKWVMLQAPIAVNPHWTPQADRLTDLQLDSMAALGPQTQQQGGRGGRGGFAAAQELTRIRNAFVLSEGAAGILQPGRGDGGTVFAQGTGSRLTNPPASLPTVIVSAEHYGRIARTLAKGVPVKVEIEADNRFYSDTNSFNIIGEIPGSDKKLKDEVVMLGAHFDSWHTGTGATDNAAGSAVMLEAMRILKTLNLPMKRTVRIGLWTGEEQGLLGSRAYVRDVFGTRDSTGLHAKQPAHDKFSAYYNVDNGTGAIRGVYLQGNDAVRPIFQAWMQPFKDLGMRSLTIRNTGGTDHLSFDGVGLPGFQFIQDEVEYGTRTHHSNQDVYDRIQEDDMKKNAVIVASFVYLTANRDEKLPRKPVAITP